jgi:arylformamidase
VSGHSAGGHLTAMALAHDWEKAALPRDLIKGAVVTSGVFDLDVVAHLSVQQEIQMTPEIARANDPLTHPPLVHCPVVVAVGGAEPKGWQQMSQDYFNYCKQQGMKADYLVIPGANHYTMSENMLDANSSLSQAMLGQMKLQTQVSH